MPEFDLAAKAYNLGKGARHQVRKAYVNRVLDPSTPKRVKKLLKDALSTHFIPEFDHDTSTVVEEEEWTTDHVQRSQRRIPRRMFNLDTGNLEEWPNGQYCILSHSWKGSEITFPMLQKVWAGKRKREMYDDIVRNADPTDDTTMVAKFQARKYAHLRPEMSDVELLRVQCEKDLCEQTAKLERLVRDHDEDTGVSVRSLLSTLVTYRNAIRARSEAEMALREAIRRQSQRAEDNTKQQEKKLIPRKTLPSNEPHHFDLTAAKDRSDEARTVFEAAKADWLAVSNEHLGGQVEALLPLLEQMKSLQKIEASLREAKRFLESPVYRSQTTSRYLWNDTICINKQDANELNDSLSMMGEWYANAELCLVHIDTTSMDWLETFDAGNRAEAAPNYHSFEDMTKTTPKWATRGWTLQELVLPKICTFVNSEWQHLPRSAEALGPYYYLVGFLSQHVLSPHLLHDNVAQPGVLVALANLDTLRTVMDEYHANITYLDCADTMERNDLVERARRLIGILDFMGIEFERNMNEDTAAFVIQDAIARTSKKWKSDLDEGSEMAHVVQLQALFDGLDLEIGSYTIKMFIKLIIIALVIVCKPMIEGDKKRISQFANVPEEECCRGFRRSRHPAEKILQLAAYRECTVATDRVYSLMGVLGVQMTVFHAEGLAKSLSRLLDEVVITTNDVSVFNWAGKDLGSSQRGRSLYPCALEGYDLVKDRQAGSIWQRRRHEEVKESSFKDRRYRLHLTSNSLTSLLRSFVSLAKGQRRNQLPIKALQNLVKVIRDTKLDTLEKQQQMDVLRNLLAYFERVDQTPEFSDVAVAVMEKASVLEEPVSEDLPMASPTSEALPMTSTANEDLPMASPLADEEPSADEPSRKGLNRRSFMKSPKLSSMRSGRMPASFSSGRLSTFTRSIQRSNSNTEEKVVGTETSPGSNDPIPNDSVPGVKRTDSAMSGSTLGSIHDWLQKTKSLDPDSIPSEVKRTLNKFSEDANVIQDREDAEANPMAMVTQAKEKVAVNYGVSPNPIVVNSAGIEGVFDIQRVIMEMFDADGLRVKARRAAHPDQKISGKCNISTAMVSLDVEFCCSAKALMHQLDVCDAVRHLLTQSVMETEVEQAETKKSATVGKRAEAKDMEDRTTRALAFVEEADLSMIAGEWVLAKFSSTPAAKWFLCNLELGSNETMYGRRIATDAIDFDQSTPDTTLEKPWEDFMEKKKTEFCQVLDLHLSSQRSRALIIKAGGKLDALSGKWRRHRGDKPPTNEATPGDGEEDLDDSDSSEVDGSSAIESLIERSTTGLSDRVGKAYDAWGNRLDAALGDNVLRKTPQRLRAAILHLDRNVDLLPAAFISDVRVHMF